MMKQIKVMILGTELEAPLTNPNLIRKFESEKLKVVEKANKSKNMKSAVDSIEAQCNAVIDFIDCIFGKGSARKVLGEETDLLTCLDAFSELMRMYPEQVNPVISQYATDAVNAIAMIEGDK